jgi:hypothetical protein
MVMAADIQQLELHVQDVQLFLIVPVETLTSKAHESSPWIFGTEPPSGLWRCSMHQAISEEQGNAAIQVADSELIEASGLRSYGYAHLRGMPS